MIKYGADDYLAMFGKVKESELLNSAVCIGQCTGCMCSCQCSCSGGIITDIEWEEM